MSRNLYVDKGGRAAGDGSRSDPFETINAAAQVAVAGDTVLVGAGEYRERIDPANGGHSATRRITYRPADGAKVVIKGSEAVTGWERVEGTVWKVAVPNGLFGDFNPFAEPVWGDWIVLDDGESPAHLGDVYLDGASLYEVCSLDEVKNPARRTDLKDHWSGRTFAVADPDRTMRVWYAEVEEDCTTIWANFQSSDPTDSLVEINVRQSIFWPSQHNLDYITVAGFEMAQAASPWTPPTAEQVGMVGPNWAKGWIIEDNIIHDAKCSAISLGKERTSGHNDATRRGDKPGYQYQLESVFRSRHIGWARERVGSHVIRRNTIFDCGQNGIVGHLGCVFSTIEDNHIYNVALKREFYGYEIAGIKLHAAIDVRIEHNRIHDCTLGTWLDWEAQGTRVSRNLYYDNCRDLFIEVTHGPHLVDNNVFASPIALELECQGGAFVGNLIGGTVLTEPILERSTPYHEPHSTEVLGYAFTRGADDRFVGNMFTAAPEAQAYTEDGERFSANYGYGTVVYNGHPANLDEYLERVSQEPPNDHKRFLDVLQPAYIRHNVYSTGIEHFEAESDPIVSTGEITFSLEESGEGLELVLSIPADAAVEVPVALLGTDLEPVRFPDQDFEENDGSPASIRKDLVGRVRGDGMAPAGPLAELRGGRQSIRVW